MDLNKRFDELLDKMNKNNDDLNVKMNSIDHKLSGSTSKLSVLEATVKSNGEAVKKIQNTQAANSCRLANT